MGGLFHRKSYNGNPSYIGHDGTLEWHSEKGELHSEDDKPACMDKDGTLFWYKNGERHRGKYKPAVIRPDGTLLWYIDGNLIKRKDPPKKKEYKLLYKGKELIKTIKLTDEAYKELSSKLSPKNTYRLSSE